MKVAAILVLAFATGTLGGLNTNICTFPPADIGRPFPQIPDTFTAVVQQVDIDKKTSLLLQEFYSRQNNLGAIYVTGLLTPGMTTHFISDARTGELFMIYDNDKDLLDEADNCEVQPLAGEEFAFPFKAFSKGGVTKDQLSSGKAVLFMGANGKTVYNGTDVVDGVPVDHWISCDYNPTGDITIKADFYFTINTTDELWQSPMGMSSPVQISVYGKAGAGPPFSAVYNYGLYGPIIPTATKDLAAIFETPIGAFCPSRKPFPGAVLPKVPLFFSFRSEATDPALKYITSIDEWYDFQSKHSRMDITPVPKSIKDLDGNHPMRVINDFNLGVSYNIDTVTYNCTVVPISQEEFDSESSTDGTKARMRNPTEFFNFDNSTAYPFQYIGQHIVRGIFANVWITSRPYPNEKSKIRAYWQWSFSAADWYVKAQDYVGNEVPLQLVVTMPDQNARLEWNFYRFAPEEPDMSVFDASPCFDYRGSVDFEFALKADVRKNGLTTHQNILSYFIQYEIMNVTSIQATRIQDMDFEMDAGNKRVLVRFRLLGETLGIVGDAANPVIEVPMHIAKDRLQKSIDNGLFNVLYADTDKHLDNFPAEPQTLRIIERYHRDPAGSHYNHVHGASTTVSPSNVQSGVNGGGGVAGLVIGCIILGAAVGLAMAFVTLRRRKVSGNNNRYSPQIDASPSLTMNEVDNDE